MSLRIAGLAFLVGILLDIPAGAGMLQIANQLQGHDTKLIFSIVAEFVAGIFCGIIGLAVALAWADR